jgi:flavin reductase
MPVTQQQFRDAMARLGAAVNVITSDGPGGRAGLTASAVCSVSDDPPTLLVCINRSSEQNAVIKANGVLCVNVLSAGQKDLSNIFAGATNCTVAERFMSGHWDLLDTGAPVLADAAVSFDCRVDEVIEKGTHSVFFAHIQAVRVGENSPALMWWSRQYHPLGSVA